MDVILTESGRIIRDEPGKPLAEFEDGRWGKLCSNISLGELLEDDARLLTPEEVANLEKSGELS